MKHNDLSAWLECYLNLVCLVEHCASVSSRGMSWRPLVVGARWKPPSIVV
jgi:hypothetical protein